MTDKFKDQDSMLPAATDGRKKTSEVKPAGGKNAKVIINPPEKIDPQRGFNERFKQAYAKNTVILEKKTEITLQAKAATADLPEETIKQVFIRGFKSLPLNSELTREQYAMNRVNSFIAGGAAMVEDCDLLPIVERVGMKGTGGAMRPHIKREKSVYNGRTIFKVVDKQGNTKHTTNDEFAAKKHLAQKYHHYMGEETDSPMKRFVGTKSLVKTYKKDTPGEMKEERAKKEKDGFKPIVAKLVPQHGKGAFEMKIKEEKLAEKFWDNEGEMVISQLKAICAKAEAIMAKLKDDSKLEAWIQSEVTTADNSIACVHDHLMYGEDSIGEAASAGIRMQRALQKAREQREREERLGHELLNPKPKEQKEETQLQEVSTGRLKSYIQVSKERVKKLEKDFEQGDRSKERATEIKKRDRGILKASHKINKKETEAKPKTPSPSRPDTTSIGSYYKLGVRRTGD